MAINIDLDELNPKPEIPADLNVPAPVIGDSFVVIFDDVSDNNDLEVE